MARNEDAQSQTLAPSNAPRYIPKPSYVSFVLLQIPLAVAGALWVGHLYGWSEFSDISKAAWFIAAMITLSEIFSVRVPRRGDYAGFSASEMPVIALVLLGHPFLAASAQIVGTIIDDVRKH